jgi:hypothetical protein
MRFDRERSYDNCRVARQESKGLDGVDISLCMDQMVGVIRVIICDEKN